MLWSCENVSGTNISDAVILLTEGFLVRVFTIEVLFVGGEGLVALEACALGFPVMVTSQQTTGDPA